MHNVNLWGNLYNIKWMEAFGWITMVGKATMVFTGDGGASEGDFHEAVNVDV